MPKKTYNNVVYHDKFQDLKVGEELDQLFRGTSRSKQPLDKSICGHNLLFDLNTNKPLDHDITLADLAKGNYACVNHNGNIKKLNLRIDEDGKQFYAFEALKEPKKPSLGKRFTNLFKSEKNKDPEVKAWNSWSNFKKTASKREQYYQKDRENTPYLADQVEGYTPQDYEKEVAAPKRQAQAESSAVKAKKQANCEKLASCLEAARNGEMGKEMQELAKQYHHLGDSAQIIANDEFKGSLDMNPAQQGLIILDYVKAVVMLHLCKDNPQLQKQFDANKGDVQKTLGDEAMMTLVNTITELNKTNGIFGKKNDNVVIECRDNGGAELMNKFKQNVAKLQKEKSLEGQQPNMEVQKEDSILGFGR